MGIYIENHAIIADNVFERLCEGVHVFFSSLLFLQKHYNKTNE